MTASTNDLSDAPLPGRFYAAISPWQLVLGSIIIAALGVAPSFITIWPKWTDTHTYSHGTLIVALSAWLLWRQRDRFNKADVGVVPFAGVILFALFLGSALAYAASIEIAMELLMPITLLCAVLFVAGVRAARIAAFPILLLYSAVSIWDVINGTLQAWTTDAVTLILGVTGVPSYIEGNVVQIPSGVFEIAGGCSGLHFFVIGLTLAAIYGHMYLQTWLRKLQLIAVMGAMSIGMNWIRVATIITAGHLTQMQSYLVKVDHYAFGWVLFVFMLVPFFLIARRIERKDEQHPSGVSRGIAGEQRSASVMPLFMVIVMALAPALAWGRIMLRTPHGVELELPHVEGTQGPHEPSGDWNPVFPGAAGEVMGSYRAGGAQIDVYVNWFDGQSQGRELIGYSADLAGNSLNALYDRVHIDSARANHGNPTENREIIATSNRGKQRIIQYYYVVGDNLVVDPLEAKLRQAVRNLRGRFGSGIIALSVACEADDGQCDRARHALSMFVASIEASIIEMIKNLDASPRTPAAMLEEGQS